MDKKKWGISLAAVALAAVLIFGVTGNIFAEEWNGQTASPTDLMAASPTDLWTASPTDLLAASPTDLWAASPTDLNLWAEAAGILDFVPGNPGDVWTWEEENPLDFVPANMDEMLMSLASPTDLWAASPTDLWADAAGVLDFVPANMDEMLIASASPTDLWAASPTDLWADAAGVLDFVPANPEDAWTEEEGLLNFTPASLDEMLVWTASSTDLWFEDATGNGEMNPWSFDTYGDPYGADAIADEDIPEEPIEQDFTDLKVGDVIRMGYYEQDGDPSNLREPIEWQVISVNRRKDVALVTTVYALDSVPFGTAGNEAEYKEPGFNWKNSAIRQWLDDEIYAKCFTSAERQRIRQATNITKDPSGRFTTQDYVFLLSRTETGRYFGTAKKLKCEPTPYALSRLSEGSSAVRKDGTCRWWVRELTHAVKVNKRGEAVGVDHNEAGYVDGSKGMATFIRKIGALTYEEDAALVRPAMWIRFDSDTGW